MKKKERWTNLKYQEWKRRHHYKSTEIRGKKDIMKNIVKINLKLRWNKCLEHNFLKETPKEIWNVDILIYIKQAESAIKIHPTEKTLGPDGFAGELS